MKLITGANEFVKPFKVLPSTIPQFIHQAKLNVIFIFPCEFYFTRKKRITETKGCNLHICFSSVKDIPS